MELIAQFLVVQLGMLGALLAYSKFDERQSRA